MWRFLIKSSSISDGFLEEFQSEIKQYQLVFLYTKTLCPTSYSATVVHSLVIYHSENYDIDCHVHFLFQSIFNQIE